MHKISSSFTWLHRAMDGFFCTILTVVLIRILFVQNMGLPLKIIMILILLLMDSVCLLGAFKLCDVFLTHDGIMLKTCLRKEPEHIALNNICKITDLWLMSPRIVILVFYKKTSVGKTILFIPKRTGFLQGETAGLDSLKRMLGK